MFSSDNFVIFAYNQFNNVNMKRIDEQKILECKRLYLEQNLSCAEIARQTGIGEATIRRRLKELGVEIIRYRQAVTLDPKTIIDLYNQEYPIWKIARMFKSSEGTISNLLKQNNIEVFRNGVKASFNHHIFDSIDTEEKAYWLGFIWADGCIMNVREEKKNYAFELGISIKDYDHLVKFCNFLGLSTNKIQIRNDKLNIGKEINVNGRKICRIQISNEHLWKTLNAYGCCPNKTYNEKFPNLNIFSDSSLFMHFLRGFFDGDGWVYLDNNGVINAGLCGQENFLEDILKNLPNTLNKNIYQQSKNMYILKWSSSKAIFFLNLIYNNFNIFLDRKFNIVAPYISNNISKSGNIGESPEMDNPEITSKITKGLEVS